MASKENQVVFQCSGCQEKLDLNSKTFPCFHSFCCSCLEKQLANDMNESKQCPECKEPLTSDQLSLSPFLVKSLRRSQLESSNWNCDLCFEDRIDSAATHWCHDCQDFYCNHCSRVHQKFNKKHKTTLLDGITSEEMMKSVLVDMCSLHQKEKGMYCEQCNVCLCDACYKKHLADSLICSSRQLTVKEEALKQKSQGPTLDKEIVDFETSLKRLNKRTINYTDELNSDCDLKCRKMWESYEEMIENAKHRTEEFCKEIRRVTSEQVERWRLFMEENEKTLKQLNILLINLRHLLDGSHQDADFVCGLRSVRLKVSSQLSKSIAPEEKCQLEVEQINWWLHTLEKLKTEMIGSVSLNVEELNTRNLKFEKQWALPGTCSCIHVSNEDSHVFVCDENSNAVMEFTKDGDFVYECKLFDETGKFRPIDICSISPNVFVVACGQKKKIAFLERRKCSPFLKVVKFMDTNKQFYSLCEINKTIFSCDLNFQVDSFTKEGEKLKTIKGRESGDSFLPRIRSDPLSGNFWGTEIFSSEIFCFNPSGQKLTSVKTDNKITDFCVNEFGHLYFCDWEGIFSIPPKKILCKFEKRSEDDPRIFILKDKIFVSLRIEGEKFIKIFTIG